MGRSRVTTVTSLLVSLALLAALPAPCVCLPETPADHGCCAPDAGYRPVAEGCCVAPAPPPETQAAKPESPTVAADLPATAILPGDVTLVREARAASPVVPLSPPLTVRRL
jgi:hypothetical protein